ncbi:hypothetical protein AVEN_11362-1 [Araneus ventricosus]|uniref:Uncharacterized protein n=1 Tax=Araneus ventricosus TaxID=182803 RepID=A0A4Y2HC77_ARAVE|nr:hypothetical protein AVEN_11362-1 [Araneus ventricosus]
MAGFTEAQASVMRRRRFCNVGGGVAYTSPFMCPLKKKSNGVKSEAGFRPPSFIRTIPAPSPLGPEAMIARVFSGNPESLNVPAIRRNALAMEMSLEGKKEFYVFTEFAMGGMFECL